MSKINRKKVVTWKSKDSHRLEVFNGKFWPKNIISIQREQKNFEIC